MENKIKRMEAIENLLETRGLDNRKQLDNPL